jgi:preprotein translocase subunit SecD
MGAVRLLRTVVPLALIATFATACGSGSSSSAGGTPTDPASAATSTSLQVRPVTARYAPGVQFGPQLPKELATQLSQQSCPMDPSTLEDQLMECGGGKTVYLMKDPITTGGVTSAVAKEIGHGKLWFVRVTLDPSTASTLAQATKSLSGTEVAYSFQGAVLTSVIVDSSFDTDRLAIIGDYDQAQATRLADELAPA